MRDTCHEKRVKCICLGKNLRIIESFHTANPGPVYVADWSHVIPLDPPGPSYIERITYQQIGEWNDPTMERIVIYGELSMEKRLPTRLDNDW